MYIYEQESMQIILVFISLKYPKAATHGFAPIAVSLPPKILVKPLEEPHVVGKTFFEGRVLAVTGVGGLEIGQHT